MKKGLVLKKQTYKKDLLFDTISDFEKLKRDTAESLLERGKIIQYTKKDLDEINKGLRLIQKVLQKYEKIRGGKNAQKFKTI